MNSFGVWYKSKDTNSVEKLNLHVNLWKLPKKIKRRYWFSKTIIDDFLDLGFKIDNYKNIDFIKVAIPEKLKWDDIFCLYDTVNKGELLRSIFNREINKTGIEGNNFIEVTETDSADKEQKFNFIKLSPQNCEIENHNDYTILKILIKDEILKLKSNQLYFRFRVSSKVINSLSQSYKPKNSILVSSFHKTEITEFLVNRKRNMPTGLILSDEDEFDIKKINFFVFIGGNRDLIQSHKPLDSLRKLEDKIWRKYITDNQYLIQNIFAYQWNDNAKDNNFNALIKFRKENSNYSTIVVFVLLFLTLSIVSKLLYSFLECSIR